ncbi:uncharacterized protein CCOS01_13210 [Colletotrichum costaricense]|uniref:Uncharacterized protein n=1 Tax=Colletotrichum costaricense TaxID=1209916 RepID=A0AAJ0DVI7_9PEZI|nr:uncharacterized protein CCOS01_13210 [Colletotrichum costaricense]KAK1515017.1 hypothetical protein CCOS01_13210 [Colletotrichum costaricense]
MNTSDSIHLQAARRTPREDLELYFSDEGPAATHWPLPSTLLYYTSLQPSKSNLSKSRISIQSNIYFTVSHHFLYPRCETSRHHWGRIELSFNDWPPLLQEQNVVPREYHFVVVFCIACSIRPTWLQRGRSDGHAGTSHGTYSRTQ